MGIATAALGATGLGLGATISQAADRYDSPTPEAASAGPSTSGNPVDGHQLKGGGGKGAQQLFDGVVWAGKQLLGLDKEPPLNTPTHSIGGGITKAAADQADHFGNDGAPESDDETVSFQGSDNGFGDDVPVAEPQEEMAADSDVDWPSDPDPNPNAGPVFDLDGDGDQSLIVDYWAR
ncbi:hypothetical protein J2Z21_007267 [Streptomyces griseochromogenes]|uniref:Uncharacterized protein n=1 Tax=Streptomyces griseochromogenes TaxID=68214 RepID=A0A1B1AYM9_9ACTN|nr:hypothetical protein [Streptomyces griseochromogenes]ANP51632.1 hypothetical protein AVL59_20330 [Streptomyces griseochromogenes]MBP2054264.1 hypothetical protein [Streptomyces griseochromogenes]